MDTVNTERDRDRSVERLLGQTLRAGASSEASGACLDAETLAAWADRGLTEDDLATAEVHLSECSRCQALVATLERTRPADPGREPWWRPSFGLGWLVPLTAAAAAIVLWVALPGNEPARSSAALVAQMPAGAAPRPQEPSLDRLQAPAAVREELRAPAAGRTEAKDEIARAAPLEERDARKPDDRDARKENRTPEQEPTSVDSLGRVSAPNAAPSARREAADRAAAPAAPAQTFAAETSTLQRQARGRAVMREIASPDPSFRWRIGAAGAVEHSTDGGSTWELLPTGVVADLTAGMSPSPSVCWLIGRTGTILLSTDGRRWRRVAFPEATDLVAVQASDAQGATVTTADGRTFRTADGGASWDRRPLQEF
jgi:photosynthesis system II assembly factor YCF48-like protein